VSPLDCYQCGRCAAGCIQNVAGEMEQSPTAIMRLLQLESAFSGQPAADEYALRALASDTPWLCAGCLACTTRCPQSVNIAATMDLLRQQSLERNVASRSKRARDIQALHRSFLDSAVGHGRIHELSLVMRYKLRTGHFMQDALLAPAMLKRHKLHMLPPKKVATQRVRDAAARLRNKEKKA